MDRSRRRSCRDGPSPKTSDQGVVHVLRPTVPAFLRATPLVTRLDRSSASAFSIWWSIARAAGPIASRKPADDFACSS